MLMLAFIVFILGLLFMTIDPLNTESKTWALGGVCLGVSLVLLIVTILKMFI